MPIDCTHGSTGAMVSREGAEHCPLLLFRSVNRKRRRGPPRRPPCNAESRAPTAESREPPYTSGSANVSPGSMILTSAPRVCASTSVRSRVIASYADAVTWSNVPQWYGIR